MTAWERMKEAIRVKARLADDPTDDELRAILNDILALPPGQNESVWIDVTLRRVSSTGVVKQGGEDFSDLNALLAQIRLASSNTGKGKPAGGGNTAGTSVK